MRRELSWASGAQGEEMLRHCQGVEGASMGLLQMAGLRGRKGWQRLSAGGGGSDQWSADSNRLWQKWCLRTLADLELKTLTVN